MPAPAASTATKLITAAVAGPKGTEHPVALPPWALRLVPVTRKLLVVPAPMVPPAIRVSMRRQGLRGV